MAPSVTQSDQAKTGIPEPIGVESRPTEPEGGQWSSTVDPKE